VVKDQADYEYLPAMALRGRTRSVQVYRVKGVGSRESGVGSMDSDPTITLTDYKPRRTPL
jgi:hypothetical protein